MSNQSTHCTHSHSNIIFTYPVQLYILSSHAKLKLYVHDFNCILFIFSRTVYCMYLVQLQNVYIHADLIMVIFRPTVYCTHLFRKTYCTYLHQPHTAPVHALFQGRVLEPSRIMYIFKRTAYHAYSCQLYIA